MSRRHLGTAAALLLAGSMALTGCGNTINPDQVLVTMDGQTKTVAVANFMCQYNAVMYDSYYVSYFGEDMWDSDIYSTGTTMADDVKEEVMDELQELYLMDAHKADYSVALTAEEEASIKTAAEAFIAANSSKAVKYMGAKQEVVEEYLRLLTVRNKMKAAIKAGVDTAVSDEESVQKRISYIFIPSDFDPEVPEEEGETADTAETTTETTVSGDEASAEEAEGKAKEYAFLISMLAETTSLEEISSQYDELNVNTATYAQADLDVEKNSTSLDVEVLQAAQNLTVGQVTTDAVATDEGYYIIRLDSDRDEDATAKKISDIIDERGSDLYDEVLQGYIDGCEWSVDEAVLGKINFKNFYKIVTNAVPEETGDEGQLDVTTDEDGLVQVEAPADAAQDTAE